MKLLQQRAKDDPGIEKFLDYFYKFCIDVLFRPIHDVPEYKDVTGTRPCLHCHAGTEAYVAAQSRVWSCPEKRRTCCCT